MIGKIIIIAEFNNPDWDGKSDSEIFSEIRLADDECFRTESIKVLRSQPQQGESGNSSPTGQPTHAKTPPSASPDGEICRCHWRDIWLRRKEEFGWETMLFCPSCGNFF